MMNLNLDVYRLRITHWGFKGVDLGLFPKLDELEGSRINKSRCVREFYLDSLSDIVREMKRSDERWLNLNKILLETVPSLLKKYQVTLCLDKEDHHMILSIHLEDR